MKNVTKITPFKLADLPLPRMQFRWVEDHDSVAIEEDYSCLQELITPFVPPFAATENSAPDRDGQRALLSQARLLVPSGAAPRPCKRWVTNESYPQLPTRYIDSKYFAAKMPIFVISLTNEVWKIEF